MKMYGYKVPIESHEIDFYHDGEHDGDWSATSTHRITGVAEKDPKYPDVLSPYDIKTGENALVVWVIWDSGDSFGWNSQAYSECVGIFKDYNTAKELANYIQLHYDDHSYYLNLKNYDFDITTSDEQNFKIKLPPWIGYFERLSTVEIDTVIIG